MTAFTGEIHPLAADFPMIGADELAQGLVTVKSLRDGQGAQVQQPLAQVADWAATLQSQA